MATKSKKNKGKKPARRYTKSKPKTKIVYRTKPTKPMASDDIDAMTRTIGKLALAGAGTIMILGVGKGIADSFKY